MTRQKTARAIGCNHIVWLSVFAWYSPVAVDE